MLTLLSIDSLAGDAENYATLIADTHRMFLGWQRMAELTTGNTGQETPRCGSACNADGSGTCVPCLPHWKFDEDLTYAKEQVR